ncbi:SDR family NAD(P)-dependent oxidoreductase [Legionella brunensis]|uniref:SDR family NAD(P)-dependent oxidoreductase n=1 Tax=Legionella brunensis TaxID=29422 RepID=UPI001930E648
MKEVSPAAFESSWRVNALGLFAISQAVIPEIKRKGQGKIIVIGATASRRGAIKTTAFASAKAAQRSLTESMANICGPWAFMWPL